MIYTFRSLRELRKLSMRYGPKTRLAVALKAEAKRLERKAA